MWARVFGWNRAALLCKAPATAWEFNAWLTAADRRAAFLFELRAAALRLPLIRAFRFAFSAGPCPANRLPNRLPCTANERGPWKPGRAAKCDIAGLPPKCGPTADVCAAEMRTPAAETRPSTDASAAEVGCATAEMRRSAHMHAAAEVPPPPPPTWRAATTAVKSASASAASPRSRVSGARKGGYQSNGGNAS